MSWSKYYHALSYVFWWLAESAAYVSAFLSKFISTDCSDCSRRSSSSAFRSIYRQISSLTLIWRSQYHFSQFSEFVSMILVLLFSFETVIMNRLKNNEELDERWVEKIDELIINQSKCGYTQYLDVHSDIWWIQAGRAHNSCKVYTGV